MVRVIFFYCRCEAGYRGAFCNLQDENFKRKGSYGNIIREQK